MKSKIWKYIIIAAPVLSWISFVLYFLAVVIPTPYYWIGRGLGVFVMSAVPIYVGAMFVILGGLLALVVFMRKVSIVGGLVSSVATLSAGTVFWLFKILADMSV